jgi:hypothetical protein
VGGGKQGDNELWAPWWGSWPVSPPRMNLLRLATLLPSCSVSQWTVTIPCSMCLSSSASGEPDGERGGCEGDFQLGGELAWWRDGAWPWMTTTLDLLPSRPSLASLPAAPTSPASSRRLVSRMCERAGLVRDQQLEGDVGPTPHEGDVAHPGETS